MAANLDLLIAEDMLCNAEAMSEKVKLHGKEA